MWLADGVGRQSREGRGEGGAEMEPDWDQNVGLDSTDGEHRIDTLMAVADLLKEEVFFGVRVVFNDQVK